MKVVIDPRIRYNYSSWYLLGIRNVLGRKSISFDVVPFYKLNYEDVRLYNSGMPFIIKKRSKDIKVFIDFKDVADISQDRYDWCDVYYKINATKKLLDDFPKVVVIAPSYGIQIQSIPALLLLFLKNIVKSRKASHISPKVLLRDYLYTKIRRRSISVYEEKVEVKSNYIFHASTLWYNQFARNYTNKYRGQFLTACKKAGLEIEGGLFYLGKYPSVFKEMPDYPRYKEVYKDFIYDKRLAIDDYIRKTKESVMVFNTPSVCECHGWKLAEYLCMGKAIVSTPLSRELPAPLVHGENIHFVNSTEELYDAVIKINTDTEYRHKLEQGARTYYETYLAPEVVIRRILCKAEELMEKRNTK